MLPLLPRRTQPYRACAPHTLGYTNSQPIPEGQLAELRPSFVREWFDPSHTSCWVRLGVDGGSGSCFFHSLASILDYHGYLQADVMQRRGLAVQLRRSFIPLLDESDVALIDQEMGKPSAGADIHREVEEERAALANPDVWASEAMIRFVMRELGVNLVFIDMGKCHAYCGVQGDEALADLHKHAPVSQPTGFIAWTNSRTHFEPIGRIRERGDGRRVDDMGAADVQFLFDPAASAKDATAVTHAMAHYASQCTNIKE